MNVLPLLDVVPRDANVDARPSDAVAGSEEAAEPFLPLLVQIVAAGLLVPQMIQQQHESAPEGFTPTLPFVPAGGTEEQPQPTDDPAVALGAILQGRIGAGIRSGMLGPIVKNEEAPRKESKTGDEPPIHIQPKVEKERSESPLFTHEELSQPRSGDENAVEAPIEFAKPDVKPAQVRVREPQQESGIALEGFQPVAPEEAQEVETRLGFNAPPRTPKEQPEQPEAAKPEVRANHVNPSASAGMLKQDAETNEGDRSNAQQHGKPTPHIDAASVVAMKRQHVGQMLNVVEPTGLMEAHTPEELKNSVIDQIVNAVKVNLNEKTPEIRIKLHPETLGEVVVRVSMDEGVMQAKIDVQTPQVKSILEGNLPQLREQLTMKNIEIPRIEIVAEMQTSLQNAAGQSGARQRQGSGKRIMSDDAFPEAEESLRALGYNTIEMTI